MAMKEATVMPSMCEDEALAALQDVTIEAGRNE
jgi:hypothetical protein